MKKLLPNDLAYKLIIKKRNAYRKFIFLSIVSIVGLGFILEESTVIFIFGIFGVIYMGLGLSLYFTMCPKCYGNFFGPKYTSRGTAIAPVSFYSNNKCNNCGYCGQ